ncbi:hypothetical protein FGB62_241g012 [Gracilaria domingensis]|nr:hypothetical protein FGB62_241g012 [Gracilaria domingensis]
MCQISSQQFQALVVAKLGEQQNELKQLREYVKDRVSAVIISLQLLPLLGPVQGKNMKRRTNGAGMLPKEIGTRNERNLHNTKVVRDAPGPLYKQFESEMSDTRLNSDDMKCIENIMGLRIALGWKRMRWHKIGNRYRQKSEIVIQAAARTPELHLISHTSHKWGLGMLAEQRTYAIQKTAKK